MLRPLAVLVALAILAGTISNLTAGPTRRLAWIGDWKPPVLPVTPPEGPGKAPEASLAGYEIDTDRAIEEHEKGTPFIDARATEAFALGRIPGSHHIPVWEATADQKVLDLMMRIPPAPGARLVLYCQGGQCEDSHMLRQKLLGAGYQEVLVYKDGYPGWEKAGRVVER